MNQIKRTISLGFTSKEVLEGQHICYIYNDDEERLQVMAKYLKSGQEAKEKLLYLVDAMTADEMLAYLAKAGVEFHDAKPGDVTVSDAATGYCPQGFFNTEEMLELVKEFHLGALDEGYAGSRGTGEMGWCLTEGRANYLDLMDYEARLNQLVTHYPYTAC
jgi:hypothetical protein